MKKDKSTKFGLHKAGYTNESEKPSTADLFLNGQKILNNLPFPIIQAKRRQMIAAGQLSRNLVIKYHIETKTRL